MGLMLIRPNDMKAVYGDTYKYAACEPPYWAGVIASYARERDVSVEILDAEALDCSPEDVANRVMERKPSLIGAQKQRRQRLLPDPPLMHPYS